MRDFNIYEHTSNPNLKVVWENHQDRDDDGEPSICAIEEVQCIMADRVVIRTTDANYNNKDIILVAETNEIRDSNGNMLGYLRFATEGDMIKTSIPAFAQILYELETGEGIEFSECNDECGWGVMRIEAFDSKMLVFNYCGGENPRIIDITRWDDPLAIEQDIRYVLSEKGDDSYVYIRELKTRVKHQMWGIVYDYRPNKDEKWLKTLCQDTYDSQEEAEKNRDGSIAEDMKVHDYNENQETQNIQVVLIYEWEGVE